MGKFIIRSLHQKCYWGDETKEGATGEHVASKGQNRINSESLKRSGILGVLGVDERIILKWLKVVGLGS
jgi:hypothetical protein